jgi:glycosyltransferase involved in cell wall biosynthesis
MASGCAVVTTDTWGVKDFVEPGKNGLTAPPKSPNVFASKLNNLLEAREDQVRFARAGRETAEEYSMAESLERELEYLYSVERGNALEASG